jgi:hypothetical protein
MLRRPKVYIGKVPASIVAELKRIIAQNGGLVMDSINEASHVVDWDEEVDSLPSELTEEFVRTLEVRPICKYLYIYTYIHMCYLYMYVYIYRNIHTFTFIYLYIYSFMDMYI